MKNISSKKLQEFFYLYFKYLEHDLLNSMLEDSVVGRNIDIIILLQDTLYLMLVGEPIEKEDWEKTKSDLNAAIDSYIRNSRHSSKASLFKPRDIDGNICKLFDDELSSLIKAYQVAYKDFSQYLPQLRLSPETISRFAIKDECNVLVQAVLEFGNALSHIAIIVCMGNDDLDNIRKAKNHIYRGILDYYKMLLRFMLPQINMSKVFVKKYYQIRIDEFLLLGKSVADKKTNNNESIMTRYKEFFNECLDKLGTKRQQSLKSDFCAIIPPTKTKRRIRETCHNLK